LVDLDGKPLLQTVIDDVATWPVDLTVVVLGSSAEEILESLDFGDAVVAINEGWADGMASSLRVGLDVLTRDPQWENAFVVLGDQPGIPSDVPVRLLEALDESIRPVMVPVYRYERGNPVLFDRSLWPRLMTLTGDVGAATFVTTHPEWVEEVRFEDLPPRDIDTIDDVADLGHEKRRGTGSAVTR
jgi:molybdenum cofactor cytidylyltransferase